MKINFLLICILLLGCDYDFLSSYMCIENNKVRPVALVIDNSGFAEAAPRDIVTIRTYFGGEKINRIQWYFSDSDDSSSSIQDTSLLIQGSSVVYSNSTSDSVILTIRIPDSVIVKAFNDASSLKMLLPPDTYDSIPPEILEERPSKIISLLETVAYSNNDNQNQQLIQLMMITGNSKSLLEQNLPLLLQVFTVPITIHGTINGKYKIEATISIRYNTRLRKLGSFVPVNRNPEISSILLYRVKGERKSFDPFSDYAQIDTTYDISITKKITFKKGYSYFLTAKRNYAITDSGFTMNRTRGPEDFSFEWFYYNENSSAIDKDSLLVLDSWPPNQYKVRLLPPLSKDLKHFSFWFVMYDYYFGERLRPVGFAVKQADVEIVN